jgi:hypothetical protein
VLVGHELTSVENVVIRAIREILLELFRSGSDEHISHEESVVRTGAHDPYLYSVLWAPPRIPINHIDLPPGVEVALGQTRQNLEGLGGHRLVHISPSDFVLADGVLDDGLGLRGTAV